MDIVKEEEDFVELKISVIDTGIGISKESQGKLFKEYSQVHQTIFKYEGTGLGLAICKKLCTLMNGSIGVISEPGKGSNFYFTVKMGKCTEQPQQQQPSQNITQYPDSSDHSDGEQLLTELQGPNETCLILYHDKRVKSILEYYFKELNTKYIVIEPCFDTGYIQKIVESVKGPISFVFFDEYYLKESRHMPLLHAHKLDELKKLLSLHNTRYNIQFGPPKFVLAFSDKRRKSINNFDIIIRKPIMLSSLNVLAKQLKGMNKELEFDGNKRRHSYNVSFELTSKLKVFRFPDDSRKKSCPAIFTIRNGSRLVTSDSSDSDDEVKMEKYKKRATVLVADDNIIITQILQHILEDTGATVVTVSDGADAVKVFKDYYQNGKHFDLVLLDMNMSKMDGITCCKEIRLFEKQVKTKKSSIVGVTGDTSYSVQQKCIAAGMNKVLFKPISKEDIIACLPRH